MQQVLQQRTFLPVVTFLNTNALVRAYYSILVITSSMVTSISKSLRRTVTKNPASDMLEMHIADKNVIKRHCSGEKILFILKCT